MIARRTTLTLALLLTPAAAYAQPPSDTDKAAARAIAQEGQDALDRKDFTTAAERFARAAEMVHAPTLKLGLARAQVGLGRWVAAQQIYKAIVREGVPPRAPPAFVKAVADARRELEALEPRIPSLVVNLQAPRAAQATLDGQALPPSALGSARPVDPGRHVVVAEAPGFPPVKKEVTVAEHQTETVTLSIDAPAAPPGEQPDKQASSSGGSIRRTLGFVGIGVGGAGLLVGVIAGGVAISKHSALKTACPTGHCPTSEQSAIDGYHVTTNLSTAGLVVGGVLAAAGVVLVVTAPKAPPGKDAWVVPVIGPGWAGAQGRF